MKSRWSRKKRYDLSAHPGLWAAGMAFAVATTALLVTMVPSARRYYRIHLM